MYTCEWHDAKGYWLDPPTVSSKKGRVVVSLPPSIAEGATEVPVGSLQQAYDVQSRLKPPLARLYRNFVQSTLKKLQKRDAPEIAALVLEPLVMGAGGMIFVDPLFQRVLIDVVRASEPYLAAQGGWSGLPVIFDEVFVGLYRLGLQSTGPLLGVNPDISVHAKILTGGLLPLAVTLASDSIFQEARRAVSTAAASWSKPCTRVAGLLSFTHLRPHAFQRRDRALEMQRSVCICRSWSAENRTPLLAGSWLVHFHGPSVHSPM